MSSPRDIQQVGQCMFLAPERAGELRERGRKGVNSLPNCWGRPSADHDLMGAK